MAQISSVFHFLKQFCFVSNGKEYRYNVTDKILADIIEFWFRDSKYNEMWVDGSIDDIIIDKYFDVLRNAEKGAFEEWKTIELGQLGLLIIFDQFTRNIYRGDDRIRKNDLVSRQIAGDMLKKRDDLQYPLMMRIFILLPFRHARNSADLDIVMSIIDEYKTEFIGDNNSKTMLKRFLNATLRDYSKVTDTIRIANEFTIEYPKLTDVLDDECLKFSPSISVLVDINTTIESDPLYRCVKKWVESNMHTLKSIAVSLSGGVDSMVLLWLFYQLKLRKLIDDIVAIHIDYGNREVSRREAEFVEKWTMMFGIPLYIRRINHIKRDGTIDRNIYEEETRLIRFGAYKFVKERNPNIFGVCLGHHKGDLAENVMMNIFRSRDLLDLNKMKDVMENDGVIICRPMLSVLKDCIYNVSHTYCIPYMKDTTSESCFRGVLRKTVFPLLEGFDPTILSHIVKTGVASDEWSFVVDRFVMKPMLSSIVDTLGGFYFPITDDILDMPTIIRDKFFLEMFHKRGYSMISKKNTNALLERLRRTDELSVFTLSNELICVKRDGFLYFFEKAIMTKNMVNKIDLRDNLTADIVLGVWKIKIVPTYDMVRTKITVRDIINGTIVYTEPISEDNTLSIGYSITKGDGTRRIFAGLGNITKFIPKVYCASGEQKKYVKIHISLFRE
jgi:tRNA(Ile)-lysidine synthetase-like protein